MDMYRLDKEMTKNYNWKWRHSDYNGLALSKVSKAINPR